MQMGVDVDSLTDLSAIGSSVSALEPEHVERLERLGELADANQLVGERNVQGDAAARAQRFLPGPDPLHGAVQRAR